MYNFVSGEAGTYSKMWAIAIHMDSLTPEVIESYKKITPRVWCYCPDTETQAHYALECGVSKMTVNDIIPALRIRQQLLQAE